MALLPLPGPTVGLATNTNTPTTTYYSWFRSLFDTLAAMVSALAAQFPAGAANTAWTDYTPTITAETGTFTSVTSVSGTYYQIGKVVFCQYAFTQTTVGTAAGDIIVTLPVASVARAQPTFATTTGELAISGGIETADSKIHLRLYDGTTAISAGRTITGSIFYEAA